MGESVVVLHGDEGRRAVMGSNHPVKTVITEVESIQIIRQIETISDFRLW